MELKDKKILICVPSMDQVPARFAHCLAMLRKVGQTAVTFKIGSLIYAARNEMATEAIKMDADYIMWFDSDMTFPPDTISRLFETMEKTGADIVSGLYYRRVAPFTPVIYDKLEFDEQGRCTWEEFKETPTEPFEIAGCGFGCVLADTEAFISVLARFGHAFTPIGGTGEDLSFCWRARQCGYKIVCDPNIPLGHVGYTVITGEYYESFKEAAVQKAAAEE